MNSKELELDKYLNFSQFFSNPLYIIIVKITFLTALGIFFINAVSKRLARWLRTLGFNEKIFKGFQHFFQVLLWSGLVLTEFSIAGIDLNGIWTFLSTLMAMMAIGFVGVWSVLSNLICALLLIIFKPFQTGDYLEILGEPVKGTVLRITPIFTCLKSDDSAEFRIPNNQFFQKSFIRRNSKFHQNNSGVLQ